MRIQDYVPTPTLPRPEIAEPAGWSDLASQPFLLAILGVAVLLFVLIAVLMLRERQDRPPSEMTP